MVATPTDRPILEMSAVERLKAFEDHALGPGCSRPYGKIETGIGSRFSALAAEDREHHAALVQLIQAEHERAAALAQFDAANARYAAAQALVTKTARHITEEEA
jgi:hypothetical protein